MIINPFEDKFEILFEFVDNVDLNIVEDYFCKAYDNRIVSVVLVDKPKDNNKLERFEQFCKARQIILDKDYLNSKLNLFKTVLMNDWRLGRKCFVTMNQMVIDKNLNLYLCAVAKNSGKEPLISIEKYLEISLEIEKLLKENKKEEAAEKIRKKMEDFNNYLMKYSKMEEDICKTSCYQEYYKYNNFIELFNQLNNNFKIY